MKLKDILDRPRDSHKGQFGRVGIIAGSKEMVGAAVLVAKACLRTGSGVVYVMMDEDAIGAVNVIFPEIICLPLKGGLDEPAVHQVVSYHERFGFDVLAIGPGLGRLKATQRFIKGLFLQEFDLPMVIDADALRCVDFGAYHAQKLVLTPHPGEFSEVFEPIYDRESQTMEVAKRVNQVVVLKGDRTVVSDGDDIYVNTTGNPGMSTAGAGDVLTGVIASLVGQGLSPFEAAKSGVYLHGLAGDKAYKKKFVGLVASDIVAKIPDALRAVIDDD